jgi:hypothetical protein
MIRAMTRPATPLTTKNNVVAREIDATGHPFSRLNAFRYTAKP